MLPFLINAIGELLKVAFIPLVIAMLVTIPAKPLLNLLPIPEETKQPLLRVMRVISFAATGLVLLAFVFLCLALGQASKDAYVPPPEVYEAPLPAPASDPPN